MSVVLNHGALAAEQKQHEATLRLFLVKVIVIKGKPWVCEQLTDSSSGLVNLRTQFLSFCEPVKNTQPI